MWLGLKMKERGSGASSSTAEMSPSTDLQLLLTSMGPVCIVESTVLVRQVRVCSSVHIHILYSTLRKYYSV